MLQKLVPIKEKFSMALLAKEISVLSKLKPYIGNTNFKHFLIKLAVKWTKKRMTTFGSDSTTRDKLVALTRLLELSKMDYKNKNGRLTNLLVNAMTLGYLQRKRFEKQHDFTPPCLLVISPTMRCNLRCTGCYAGKYTQVKELDFETVDRIITEAKEMGIYFITISGGEPYAWKPLFDIFKKHNDVFFQTYTNGTFIDEGVAKKLAELGNVAPAISVEGFETQTDARRGRGVYSKVLKAMELLKKHNVGFGFSVTYTRHNSELVASDEFIDFYIKKGCSFGWYFHFVPVGKDDSLALMPTSEQRIFVGKSVRRFLYEKPIFVIDFWNSGAMTDGCMAGGRHYAHISCEGYVEPCVFTHFAVDNIKKKSLKECLNSKLFQTIREKHQKPNAYKENPLRPCIIIDRPEQLRQTVKECSAFPTHAGADNVTEKLAKELDDYSEEYGRLANEEWEKRMKE